MAVDSWQEWGRSGEISVHVKVSIYFFARQLVSFAKWSIIRLVGGSNRQRMRVNLALWPHYAPEFLVNCPGLVKLFDKTRTIEQSEEPRCLPCE